MGCTTEALTCAYTFGSRRGYLLIYKLFQKNSLVFAFFRKFFQGSLLFIIFNKNELVCFEKGIKSEIIELGHCFTDGCMSD